MIREHSQESKAKNQLVNGNESSINSDSDPGKSSPVIASNCQKHLYHQDFVPYVVRVARLLLQKVEKVKPMTLKSGEPQLTMTSIYSLEDLAPFFAALCDGVTRQQTTSKSKKISNFKVSDQIEHENSNPRKNLSASSSS